jgi:hypothetical protein
MIVPFTELPDAAGGWPRPLLDIRIADLDDVLVPCLVDSGALHTLLPTWVADAAGVDLRTGESLALGVAATGTTARFVTTQLAIGDHAWEAEVGFCDPWPYGWGLLGQRSFFRFFTVTSRTADFELEVMPIDG